MKHNNSQLIVISILFASCLFFNNATAEIYMCVDPDVNGGSPNANYRDCVEIQNFSDNVTRTIDFSGGGGGGGGGAAPEFSPIVVAKSFDTATINLRRLVAIGTPVDILFHFVTEGTGGEDCEYYRVGLEGALFESHSFSATANDQPFESVGIAFPRVEYTLFESAGPSCTSTPSQTWGFDIATNSPF